MDKIVFNESERSSFISAINNLIKEVEYCLERNNTTQNSKISVKGSSRKYIEKELQFLHNNYGYSCKVGLGNAGGFLNDDSWIMFARDDLLEEDLINGKRITPQKGINIYIRYGGYLNNQRVLELRFGFPDDGGIESARCLAVNEIEKSGALKKYQYSYDYTDFVRNEQEKERILNDFLEIISYFKSFSKEEFRIDMKTLSNKSKAKEFLNQILYGPPGTGKTYHTIDKALEILAEVENIQIPSQDNRKNRKKLFDEYVEKGQIVFTTFHQSYGYEEFVEGIKPIINDESNSKEVQYEINDGVFKEICDKALKNYENSNLDTEELRERIELEEKVEKFLNRLLETNESIGKTKGGNFFINSFNNNTIEVYSEGVERFGGIFKLSLSTFITLLKSNVEFNNAVEMFKKVFNRNYADRTHTYYFNLVNKFKEYEKQVVLKTEDNEINNNSLKPYIIIIDEINRGNVSKIFGELITLIEPSKRLGGDEELRVSLPYSRNEFDNGKGFGVPKNVYILGTMNTADRSITSLDTALRRRFEFIEMMPIPSLLQKCEEVDLQKLLEAINTRIEYLLDREKTIGHAFFIDVKNLEDLKNVFQNKIIPLLQEYFYNDYALINAVLNDNGMIGEDEEDKKDDKYLQKIKNLDNVDNEKNIYNITSFNNEIWDKPETYQAIYDDEKNQSNNEEQ